MSALVDFVSHHTLRDACKCGKCIDPGDPNVYLEKREQAMDSYLQSNPSPINTGKRVGMMLLLSGVAIAVLSLLSWGRRYG